MDADAPAAGPSRLAPSRARPWSDVLAGGGIGLLLGVVVGLSTSPVVAIVVGALTSLLAVLLGLEERGESRSAFVAKVQLNGLRIGAFAVAAVLGVLAGMWMRLNNPLAESPEQGLKRWQAAFPDNTALATQLMVYERLGLRPLSLAIGASGVAIAETTDERSRATSPGLFSGRASVDLCSELAPSRYGDHPDGALDAWGDEKGPVAEAARRIRQLPAEQRLAALQGAHALLCATAATASAAPASGAAR